MALTFGEFTLSDMDFPHPGVDLRLSLTRVFVVAVVLRLTAGSGRAARGLRSSGAIPATRTRRTGRRRVLDVLRSCGEAAESTGAYLQLDGVGVRFGTTGDWWCRDWGCWAHEAAAAAAAAAAAEG